MKRLISNNKLFKEELELILQDCNEETYHDITTKNFNHKEAMIRIMAIVRRYERLIERYIKEDK